MNVLVSSLSHKVPLVKALRCAYERLGLEGKIYGADLKADCPGRQAIDAFWLMPPLEGLAVSDLIAYCHAQEIQAILPTRDGELPYYARYREALEDAGIHVMVSSLEAVGACTDKKAFYDALHSRNFPVIPTLDTPDASISDRWVVKERYGAGSRTLCLNVSVAEALAVASGFESPLFQPFISGPEFSVDLYRARTGEVLGVIARRRDEVRNGESCVTTTHRLPEWEAQCAAMAEALGLEGHALFQVIGHPEAGTFHVVECNARVGGASALSFATGLNSLAWFLKEAQGQSPTDIPFVRAPGEKRLVRENGEDWITDDPGF